MNQTTDAVLAGLVLVAMGALAASDARRAVVEPRLVLALVAAAAAWRFGGSGDGEGAWPRLAESVLGAALGIAAVIVPIGAAAWLRRRWPLYPGDAMMLGALGFLLGPLGLAWTMVLGAGFALAYRLCLQRRRGRPFRKGLVPLGPACAPALPWCSSASTAASRWRATRRGRRNAVEAALPAPPTAVGPDEAPTDPVPLSATELGPDLPGLPAGLAARQVRVEHGETLPFPALVRRLSTLTGVAIRIEERPARIVGGAVVLAEPPPLALAWEGTLAGLLDRVAILTGYDWFWETLVQGTLVARDPRAGDTRAGGRGRLPPLLGRGAAGARSGGCRGGRLGFGRRPGGGGRRLDRRSRPAPDVARRTRELGRAGRLDAGVGTPGGITRWARRRPSGAASWRRPTCC